MVYLNTLQTSAGKWMLTQANLSTLQLNLSVFMNLHWSLLLGWSAFVVLDIVAYLSSFHLSADQNHRFKNLQEKRKKNKAWTSKISTNKMIVIMNERKKMKTKRKKSNESTWNNHPQRCNPKCTTILFLPPLKTVKMQKLTSKKQSRFWKLWG